MSGNASRKKSFSHAPVQRAMFIPERKFRSGSGGFRGDAYPEKIAANGLPIAVLHPIRASRRVHCRHNRLLRVICAMIADHIAICPMASDLA
jgi:hypothetical protein